MQVPSVSSSDIMSRLRQLINIVSKPLLNDPLEEHNYQPCVCVCVQVECDLYGNVLLDNTLVVLVLPIITNATSNITVSPSSLPASVITFKLFH